MSEQTPSIAERIDASTQVLRHGRSTERTVFFSDAVFAIAMTLLVLDLRVDLPANPSVEEINQAMVEKVPAFASFLLSFVLVGVNWVNHHRRFKGIKSYDARLQNFNLLFLFFVAFMPVPTSLLFANAGSPWPVVLYAVVVSGISLSLNLIWWHAHRAGLMDKMVSEALYRYSLYATAPVWGIFLLSIPFAFVGSGLALYLWILILPASVIQHRVLRRRFVRRETARFEAEDAAAAQTAE
ncbi:putative membrane protein [Psychromicrobium silvestre]|uniref:Putative membrane protein n=1 Tax=Psychromicrobium silvestre TaxID=1645614 RepID=A0A7Y9LUX9_9MICC|nr:TMEM175 family protein [Psychromicrobium silvestre]NYE96073.1 putative membrane protein [Psychromicrobium silvestre]